MRKILNLQYFNHYLILQILRLIWLIDKINFDIISKICVYWIYQYYLKHTVCCPYDSFMFRFAPSHFDDMLKRTNARFSVIISCALRTCLDSIRYSSDLSMRMWYLDNYLTPIPSALIQMERQGVPSDLDRDWTLALSYIIFDKRVRAERI